MDRKEYLAEQHVAGFLEWLRGVIVADQAFTQSFYPRNGRGRQEVNLTSFRCAVKAYDFAGQDLGATQRVFDRLSENILPALQDANDTPTEAQQHTLLIGCLQTLVWGGVTVKSTIDWLASRAQDGALHDAIITGSRALTSDSYAALEPFKNTQHLRSDSAATKLYAIADHRSIIYDNRVGAALAKLVCEFLDQRDIHELPETLAFMVKTNDVRRNPSVRPDRIFKPKVTGHPHARWNQRANWMINALVANDDVVNAMRIFKNVTATRTIEAALFVMGDDVRNMTVQIVQQVPEVSHETRSEKPLQVHNYALIPENFAGTPIHHFCVPAGHDFGRVVKQFHLFREDNPGSNDLAAIRRYLSESMQVMLSTAKSYRHPLEPQQFNLVQENDELVCCLAVEPLSEEAFVWLQQKLQAGNTQKIMVCTWTLGILWRQGCIKRSEQAIALVDRGFAGNVGGAKVMINVGLKFGEHFALLSKEGAPTERFGRLFPVE